jgi:glyoxylase-like metal-dependent hydrolase (beta-lactamase superfamily II)
MELIKGVYQLMLPVEQVKSERDQNTLIKTDKDNLMRVIEQKVQEHRKPFAVNCYLIEGTKENLLIDPGLDSTECYAVLVDELKKYGFDIKDINTVVVTHIHPDHYGLAGRIKQVSGAKIALGDIEAAMLNARYLDMNPLIEEIKSLLYLGGAPVEMISSLSESSLPLRKFVNTVLPDIKLKEGKKISVDPFEFKILVTPGHTAGHVCLYEQNRKLLFSGDHILPEITPHISYHAQSSSDPLGDYIKSLKNMMKLEVRLVFPGHGPSFSGLHQRIEALLLHHEHRNAEIIETIQNDMKTAYQIAMEISWLEDNQKGNFPYMEIAHQRLAIMETLAHLQNLVKQNKATKTEKDGIYYYHAM